MKIINNMFGLKTRSKRKGITPVIAIVLLLMMTVAAAGMAYVWIMSIQEDIAADTERDLANFNKQKNARLSISAVWNDSGDISMIIKNAGTYVYTADDVGNIQILVGSEVITPTTCGSLSTQGTTCTVDSSTAFPTTAGELGAVTMRIVAPIGMGDTYTCSVPTMGGHHTSC